MPLIKNVAWPLREVTLLKSQELATCGPSTACVLVGLFIMVLGAFLGKKEVEDGESNVVNFPGNMKPLENGNIFSCRSKIAKLNGSKTVHMYKHTHTHKNTIKVHYV